ncbi:NAD(P)-dependent oxidoreductase [Paraburkholderia terricola]|uniref:3-hydroxyisobutyrate dehydrogenase n=1 Tax=Paraburkholderia terricola TaxID=169427 RepID=A0A1M6T4W7_9BURK|nr:MULTISPECIES: NAD-binding protein [Paraburkholderia]SDO69968.1 3-hydroxyisobutyrate dehydrogenase [Paraburkholderia sediminicola]SHK52045.1 3-hydroxyisobutyrate dehydrogenase [Paraburkholderia terricola]
MNRIGVAGSGKVATFVVHQLAKKYSVRVLRAANDSLLCDGVEEVHDVADLVAGSDIVILCTDSDELRATLLRSPDWGKQASAEKRVVIDMGQGDPDETKIIATTLSEVGITLVDAPLHTENTAAIETASAILFGGPPTVLESVRGVLESVCPTIIACGDVGNGHAMRLVVAAIAACNRLITYECAAMGAANGLAIADMATVLNSSSGYNSASARVLPALATNERTADVTLGNWADDLRMASAAAMRYGAPMLLATMARSTLDAAANRLGGSSSVDRLAEIWEIDAGLPAPGMG